MKPSEYKSYQQKCRIFKEERKKTDEQMWKEYHEYKGLRIKGKTYEEIVRKLADIICEWNRSRVDVDVEGKRYPIHLPKYTNKSEFEDPSGKYQKKRMSFNPFKSVTEARSLSQASHGKDFQSGDAYQFAETIFREFKTENFWFELFNLVLPERSSSKKGKGRPGSQGMMGLSREGPVGGRRAGEIQMEFRPSQAGEEFLENFGTKSPSTFPNFGNPRYEPISFLNHHELDEFATKLFTVNDIAISSHHQLVLLLLRLYDRFMWMRHLKYPKCEHSTPKFIPNNKENVEKVCQLNDPDFRTEKVATTREDQGFQVFSMKIDWGDIKSVKPVIEADGMKLCHVRSELQKNVKLVKLAIKQNARALKYASISLQADEKIVEVCVKEDGLTIRYAPLFCSEKENTKKKENIRIFALSQNGESLNYLSSFFRDSEPHVKIAVQQRGIAIMYASERLQDHRHIALLAVKNDARAYHYISEELQNTKEIVIETVKNDHMYLIDHVDPETGFLEDPHIIRVFLRGFIGQFSDKIFAHLRTEFPKGLVLKLHEAKKKGEFVICQPYDTSFFVNANEQIVYVGFCKKHETGHQDPEGFGFELLLKQQNEKDVKKKKKKKKKKQQKKRKTWKKRKTSSLRLNLGISSGPILSCGGDDNDPIFTDEDIPALRHSHILDEEYTDSDCDDEDDLEEDEFEKRFVGYYKDGFRDGLGVLFMNNRVVYEGKFCRGKRNGRGQFTDLKTGIRQRGNWVNGILDKTDDDSINFATINYEAVVEKHCISSKQIGTGGFGTVYVLKSSLFKDHCLIPSSADKVAVKIMRTNPGRHDYVLYDMTKRGICLIGSIPDRENVLDIYAVIRGKNICGYVMKLCRHSVQQLISDQETETMSLKEKTRILEGTAKGMRSLHSNLVMHRDLKWDNVLIDYSGNANIIDFETLREDEREWRLQNTKTRSQYGTYGMLSPEVQAGLEYSLKCDVFAYGIMIYSLLWGVSFPYANLYQCTCGKTMDDIMRLKELDKHVSECSLRPSLSQKEIEKYPKYLIEIMIQSWDKNPYNRPSFEEIVFRIDCEQKKSFEVIKFQFPQFRDVIKDQIFYLTQPYQVRKIRDWIEKKRFEGSKLVGLKYSRFGAIETDEDLNQLLQKISSESKKDEKDEVILIAELDQKTERKILNFYSNDKTKEEESVKEEEVEGEDEDDDDDDKENERQRKEEEEERRRKEEKEKEELWKQKYEEERLAREKLQDENNQKMLEMQKQMMEMANMMKQMKKEEKKASKQPNDNSLFLEIDVDDFEES